MLAVFVHHNHQQQLQQLQHSVHTYKKVRDAASHSVTLALKRYPCLTAPCLPFLLSGLANLPRPSTDSLLASLDASSTGGERLRQAFQKCCLSRARRYGAKKPQS